MMLELSAQEVECIIDCVELAMQFSGVQSYSNGFLYALYSKLTDESVRSDIKCLNGLA